MSRPPPPATLTSSTSSSSLVDHFPNLRQFFQRSMSHPSHEVVHAHDNVLATAVTALFRAINAFGEYDDATAATASLAIDTTATTRRAKLLYVQLLDAAQKERGEWCGFASDPDAASADTRDDAQENAHESVAAILTAHLADLPRGETFALLNELVDVSFRSMRGPLVDTALYAKHKRQALQSLSLDIPASLRALLEVRAILNELARDEKLCLFRLLALWHAMAVANEAHDLTHTIQDKHHLVFSDCSELEFLTTRRDPRLDPLAVALLHILVLYHDVLFSDVEFLLIKQELQLSPFLQRPSGESSPEAAVSSPVDIRDDAVESETGVGTDTTAADATRADEREVHGSVEAEASAASSGVPADEQLAQVQSQPVPAEPFEPATAVTSSSARTSPSHTAQQHNGLHARGHGPVVSIRPHALSPRKGSKHSRRSSFDASAVVSTIAAPPATVDGGERASHHHHHHERRHSHGGDGRGSGKADSARPGSPLSSIRANGLDMSSKSKSKSSLLQRHDQVAASGSSASDATKTPRSSIAAPVAAKSTSPHEITDLANTYFSFSFTAATVRTMAIMAFYAIRRHQHNH